MDLGSSPAGTDEQILNMGIMTESRSSGVMKLQAMVDKKITCIAKNYSVDDETKAGLQKLDGAMTATIDAPNDPMQPVFIQKTGPADQGASQLNDEEMSDEENTTRKV